MNRRSFLVKSASALFGAGFAGTGGYIYGTRFETEWLELVDVSIPIAQLPSGLEGFRIVLLSDFHLYPHTRLEFIRQVVETANDLRADLIALTGDFVQGDVEAIFDLAPTLGLLNAKHGVFSVLGNHDHWKGPATVRTALDREGLSVLYNQGVTLTHNGTPFFLTGIDDAWSGHPDLQLALREKPAEAPCILLAHEPDPADDYAQDGRVMLQLSGHSHGGQVRFPGIGSPFLPPLGRKYDLGLYRVGDMWLYTNRGIGVTVPIRLNCRPELTVVTLTAAPS